MPEEIQFEMANSFVLGVLSSGDAEFETVVDKAAQIGIPIFTTRRAIWNLAGLGFIDGISGDKLSLNRPEAQESTALTEQVA